MVMNRLAGKLSELLDVAPFRIIEMLVSFPMFAYGLFLLSGIEANTRVPGVLLATGAPELNAEINGTLYVLAGTALFWAAKSGVILARRISAMAFFFAMLYSIVFRWVEVVITPASFVLFWVCLVVAAVDYMHTTRRGRP